MRLAKYIALAMSLAIFSTSLPANGEQIDESGIVTLPKLKCKDDGWPDYSTFSTVLMSINFGNTEFEVFGDLVDCKKKTRSRFAFAIYDGNSLKAKIGMDGEIAAGDTYQKVMAKLAYGSILWLAQTWTILDEAGNPVKLPDYLELH